MQGALQGAALCGCRAAPRRLAASPSATGRRRVSLPVPERPDKPRTIFDEDYQAERATPVPSRWQTLLAQKTQEGTRQPAAGSRSKELLKRDTGGDIERVTNALVSDTGSRFTATVSSQGRDVMRRLLATEDTAHPHTRTARPKRSPDLPVLADLPISQWPFPGDQESSIVRYDNPRPSHFLGNPRPSVQDAVDSGRADLLAKVLETDAFLEREGDGMGSRWDPTCQLLDGSINHTSSKEMWVVHAEAEGVAQAPPADARHTAHTDSAERRLRLARREATPLGHALAESAGHDLVRLLVENTMCNPNLTIVIHDAEPLGCGTAPAPAGGGRGALLRRNRVPIAERPAAVQRGSGGAAAPAYGTVEVSPLYYCLALGHTEAADLLLRHPSLDPRIGYFSKDPRSVVKPLRCSHLRPELAEAEAALDRQDAATVTHGLVERADMHRSLLDFMSAPRRSLGSDVQKAQLFSVGIGKI